jgi:hypothetical protein
LVGEEPVVALQEAVAVAQRDARQADALAAAGYSWLPVCPEVRHQRLSFDAAADGNGGAVWVEDSAFRWRRFIWMPCVRVLMAVVEPWVPEMARKGMLCLLAYFTFISPYSVSSIIVVLLSWLGGVRE